MAIRRDRLSVSNRNLILSTLALSYIAKFVLYRYAVELNDGLNAWQTIGAYTILVGVSMLLACIGMYKGRIGASLLTMVVVDVWLFANIIYYKSNFLLLDWFVIQIADNMKGFEDSIESYLQWWYFLIPAISIVVGAFLIRYRSVLTTETIPAKRFLGIIGISFAIYMAGTCLGAYGNEKYAYDNEDKWVFEQDRMLLLKVHSPIGHMVTVVCDGIKDRIMHHKAIRPLNEQEKGVLSDIYTDSVEANVPQGHLVFVLVESLESWPFTVKDNRGVEVCEQLNRYMQTHNVLFCPRVTSQQKYGRSGDGQLITQTGMLPLSSGVTCMSHGDNVYPNLAHFYPDGVVLNPYAGVWNQHVTTYSYGFKRLRETSIFHKGTDSLMISWAREELEQATEPTCVLLLTLETHAPFRSARNSLDLGNSYPTLEAKYLQCVHQLDAQLGRFLAWADTTETMKDATIVITADHNHFPVRDGKGLCPLIICSPQITQSTFISEAYQMDIFPTVLHAIGQSNYAWHGFGIDLLDSTAQRTISVSQAYSLSDKMIRTNYFKK